MAGGWENGPYRQSGMWFIDLDINSCTLKGKTFSYLSHNTHMGCSCFSLFCQTFCCIYNTSFEEIPTFLGRLGHFCSLNVSCTFHLANSFTPLRINIEPKKHPIEKEHHHSSSSKPSCLGSMSIFRGVYYYSDGNHLSLPSVFARNALQLKRPVT